MILTLVLKVPRPDKYESVYILRRLAVATSISTICCQLLTVSQDAVTPMQQERNHIRDLVVSLITLVMSGHWSVSVIYSTMQCDCRRFKHATC